MSEGPLLTDTQVDELALKWAAGEVYHADELAALLRYAKHWKARVKELKAALRRIQVRHPDNSDVSNTKKCQNCEASRTIASLALGEADTAPATDLRKLAETEKKMREASERCEKPVGGEPESLSEDHKE